MNSPRIPFLRPTVPAPDQWLPFLRESYRINRFSNFGPACLLLERRLSERFGNAERTFLLTSSGTSGLAAALLARRIRGRVALPAFTFPATMRAVEMAGCTPVLCDVDPVTWEMSPATLEPLLAAGYVDAVIPVRVFGLCRDHSALVQKCQESGVPVIMDSAAAFGGQLTPGEWVGCQGIAEVFSFHATKVFGIGEGGAICVEKALAEDVRSALNFGLAPKATGRGLNGKLSEFAAAVGLAVLDCLDESVARRRTVAARYLEELARCPDLTLPQGCGNPVWQCFPLLLPDRVDADEFVKLSSQREIEIRRYYHPALSPCHTGESAPAAALDISRRLAAKMVCLPLYSDMSIQEQDEVIACVEQIVNRS